MYGMLLTMLNMFSTLMGTIFLISFSPVSCNPTIPSCLFCMNFVIGVQQFVQPYFIIDPRTFIINGASKMST
jgi:hypothetical protein